MRYTIWSKWRTYHENARVCDAGRLFKCLQDCVTGEAMAPPTMGVRKNEYWELVR